MGAPVPGVDWEAIERDYRAGVMTYAEVAAAHGNKITRQAICKRAKRDGWERDLRPRIQARAEALVQKREATRANVVAEREVIEANAERIAQVQMEHRATSYRLRALGLSQLAELEQMSAPADDEGGAESVPCLALRVDLARKITDTLKTIIVMERDIYSLGNAAGHGADGAFEQMLDLLQALPQPSRRSGLEQVGADDK